MGGVTTGLIHAVEYCFALKRKEPECTKDMNVEHMAMKKNSYNSSEYAVI